MPKYWRLPDAQDVVLVKARQSGWSVRGAHSNVVFPLNSGLKAALAYLKLQGAQVTP